MSVEKNIMYGGRTVSHTAAMCGRTEILKLIINSAKTIDLDVLALRDDGGRTPLHLAVLCGHADTVKMIMEENPELAAVQDNDGYNALHFSMLGANCNPFCGGNAVNEL
jgi:ankyrin repeat protein